MSEVPFFVVGSPRSGTTLLRRLLCAHPRLYIPGETGFLPFLRLDPSEPLSPPDVARLLRRIGSLNRYWMHAPEELANLRSGCTPGELLSALYADRARKYGAERWGDKTPGYVRYLRFLDRLFPNCQVLHIIRDGRDVALSAHALWGANHWYMDLHYLLCQWAINTRTGRRDGEELGTQRYMELRYEDLVTRPRVVMARALGFLGEEMATAVEEAIVSGHEVVGDRFHPNVHRPVSDASVGRWKSELAPREAKLADMLVGDLLTELNCPLSGLGPLTLSERLASLPGALRYALAAPARSFLYGIGALTLNRGLRSKP